MAANRSWSYSRIAGVTVAAVVAAISFAGCKDEPLGGGFTTLGGTGGQGGAGGDAGGGEAGSDGTSELPPEMLEGVAEVLLIDDFDDGDEINEVGGEWIIYDDVIDGGESTTVPPSWDEAPFESDAPGYGDTGFALHLTGTTGDVFGYDFVGFDVSLHPDALCPNSTPTELDLNDYDGVHVRIGRMNVGGGVSHPAPEVMSLLRDRKWPGNVRQLETVLLRAMLASGKDEPLGLESIQRVLSSPPVAGPFPDDLLEHEDLDSLRRELEIAWLKKRFLALDGDASRRLARYVHERWPEPPGVTTGLVQQRVSQGSG